MSNTIDPDSIHLGKNDAQYYAEYFPSSIPAPGTPCALPPEIPWQPHSRPLLPLNQACQFTFPDVTPLPPIYNPPVFDFAACEELTTDVRFTVSNPLRGSTLTLTTKGPSPSPTGLSECGFILTQDLKLADVCESFKTDTNIKFGKNFKNSDLKIIASSVPECGFELQGNFELGDVCETADVMVDIGFLGAARHSVISGRPSPLGGCDTWITGAVVVEACESFRGGAAVRFGPKLANSSLVVETFDIPDCGFVISGDIDIADVCETANINSKILFKGAARQSSLKFAPIPSKPGQFNCDTELTGVIDVTACENFDADVNITFGSKLADRSSLSFVEKSTPNCGFFLTGNIDVGDVCETATITTSVTFSGPFKDTTQLSIRKPLGTANKPYNCDAELFGSIDINTCEQINLDTDIKVTNGTILKKNNWIFRPTDKNNDPTKLVCDFTLDADIEFKDVCTEFELDINFSERFVGTAIKKNTLKLVPLQTPLPPHMQGEPDTRCGVTVEGELTIDACTSTGMTVKVNDGTQPRGTGKVTFLAPPTLEEPRKVLFEYQPSLSLAISNAYLADGKIDPCNSEIELIQDDIEVIFNSAAELAINENPLEVIKGDEWRREVHALRLNKENNELSLKGGGCCTTEFTCGAADGILTKNSIILDTLKIKYEEWAAPECCEQTCGHHYMDWCPGIGEWKTWYLKTIEPSPCCAGGANKIDMCTGDISFSSSSNSSYSNTVSLNASSGLTCNSAAGAMTQISASSMFIGGGECSAEEGSIIKVDVINPSPCCQTQHSSIDVCKGTAYLADENGNAVSIYAKGITIRDQDGNSATISSSGVVVSSSSEAGECDKKVEQKIDILYVDELKATKCCETASYLDLCGGDLYLETSDGASTQITAGDTISVASVEGDTITMNTGGISISSASGGTLELSASGITATGDCGANIELNAHKLTPPSCCEQGSSSLDLCEGNLYLEKNGASTDIEAGGAITVNAEDGSSLSLDTAGITFTSAEGGSITFDSNGITSGSSDCSEESKLTISIDRLQSSTCDNGRNYMDFSTGWIHLEDEEGNNSDIIAGTSITLTSQAGDSVDLRASGLNIDAQDGSSLNIVTGNTIYTEDANGAYVDITPGDAITIEDSAGSNATLGVEGLYMNSSAGDAVNIYIIQGKTATWREVTFCVDGTDKKAWVLMTEPE